MVFLEVMKVWFPEDFFFFFFYNSIRVLRNVTLAGYVDYEKVLD